MLLVPLLAPARHGANSVTVQRNNAGGGSGGYKYKIAVVTHGGAGGVGRELPEDAKTLN